jgi:hypothetical protein
MVFPYWLNGIRCRGYQVFSAPKKFSSEQVRDGSNHCREDDPSGSLVKRGRSLMFLELLDQIAVLLLDPIDARFVSIQSGMSGVGALIDPTHFG